MHSDRTRMLLATGLKYIQPRSRAGGSFESPLNNANSRSSVKMRCDRNEMRSPNQKSPLSSQVMVPIDSYVSRDGRNSRWIGKLRGEHF